MTPTEHEGTVAVDAAARAVHELRLAELRKAPNLPPGYLVEFDDLRPLEANRVREAVLPIVWPALEALPDRGRCDLCGKGLDEHTVQTERVGRGLEVRPAGWRCPE